MRLTMAHGTGFLQRSYRRQLANGIFSILLVTILVGCSTVGTPDNLQSTSKKPAKHLPGKFVWHDLLTSDIETAKEFYGPLFDWSFEQGERYVAIKRGGQRIGGMVHVDENANEHHVARWITSLSVANVDKAVELLVKRGGKVHEGPAEIGRRGRVAFVSDPNGAQLALINSGNGDPIDQPIEAGTWLWHELWTDEPKESIAFYVELAGYTSVEDLGDYWLLKTGERWRAGVRSLFERELEQRWVPVIRVKNARQTSELAVSLGGSIIIAAGDGDTEHVALLADISGALFMVQEWYGKDEIERQAQ